MKRKEKLGVNLSELRDERSFLTSSSSFHGFLLSFLFSILSTEHSLIAKLVEL